MDEFTDNQLELVEQAMLESSFGNGSAKDVMAKLRKKPERFRAGEVGWSTVIGEYLAAPKEEMHLYQGCRPLNQREVGPDYVPRAEFEKVESALGIAKETIIRMQSMYTINTAFRVGADGLDKIHEIMEIPQ